MTDILLKIDRLCLQFDSKFLFKDISFDGMAGDIVGLFGPNGSGKTSFLNVISGIQESTSGSILYYSGSPKFKTYFDISTFKGGIVRTFQIPELANSLSVADHLLLADSYFSMNICSLINPVNYHTQRNISCTPKALKYIRRFGLESKLQNILSTLSYGERRLVANICALLTGSRILLLDEPFANLSIQACDIFKEIVLEEINSFNKMAIITEHNPDNMISFATRYMHIQNQKLIELPIETLNESKMRNMLYTMSIEYG